MGWTTVVECKAGTGIFSLHHRDQIGYGDHPASYPVGTGGFSYRGEADRSSPSSAEVKNTWSLTSSPQYIFMARCLIKQRKRLHDVVLS
jgi:hypothetical protein